MRLPNKEHTRPQDVEVANGQLGSFSRESALV